MLLSLPLLHPAIRSICYQSLDQIHFDHHIEPTAPATYTKYFFRFVPALPNILHKPTKISITTLNKIISSLIYKFPSYPLHFRSDTCYLYWDSYFSAFFHYVWSRPTCNPSTRGFNCLNRGSLETHSFTFSYRRFLDFFFNLMMIYFSLFYLSI